MDFDKNSLFPLSVTKEYVGTRRIAREKVLQVIYANFLTGISVDTLFPHIYNRIFRFNDVETSESKSGRLLKPSEVEELSADIPVKWKETEIAFMQDLIKSVLNHKTEIDELMKNVSEHWEIDRIAAIDRAIVHIALNELLYFDDIPIKVSINEAIEIARAFSTDKSDVFINGVIDNINTHLKKEGKIIKTGKGLQEK